MDTVINQLSVPADDPDHAVRRARSRPTPRAVNVYNYAVSRGSCDEFAERGCGRDRGAPTVQSIQAIRNNFGFDCNGVRMPATARSTYSATGKLNYTYGTGSRVSLSLSQSRFHGHTFPFIIGYINNLSTGWLRGFSNRNRLATLNWTQNLSKSAERALALDVALSYQQDRTINAPLTIESDLEHPGSVHGLHPRGHGLRVRLRQLPGRPRS